MNQVTQVKSEIRKARWKQLIQECQSSGMTVRNWCAQNGIKEQTYYRNLQKLRQEICDSLPVPVTESQKPVAFKKLEVQTPVPATQAAVIIRFNGATVEINEGTSQQTIQAVLLALQSVC